MATQHPLATLRERLLDSPNPAAVLQIADNYLQSMQKMGDKFILPADHIEVLPILEYYAGDLAGWVRYLKWFRDNISQKDNRFRELYELYRTVEIRRVQRERRDRLNLALDIAIRKRLVEDDYQHKQRYVNRCTQEWAKQRSVLLTDLRNKTKNGKLSEEERSAVLEEFWAEIDKQLERGEVPEP